MNSEATGRLGIDDCRSSTERLMPCFEIAAGGSLSEIVIVPWGTVESTQGTFVIDEEAGRMVEEAFAAHGNHLPMDYEHQTLGGEYSSPTGQAPASGWINRIWADPGRGLIAAVEWTERALQMIRSKEYRYLSPVTIVRKEDGKVTEIHSVALTNKPAIPRMEPLAAKQSQSEKEINAMADPTGGGATTPTGDGVTTSDPGMAIARIAEALGITDVPDAQLPEAILEAVRKLKGKGEGEEKGEGAEKEGAEGEGAKVASKTVLDALGVEASASESEVVVAINTLAKGNELLPAANKRITALEEEVGATRAEKLMAPHIVRGAINPNNAVDTEECVKLAMSEPVNFERWIGSRPDGSMAPPPGRTTAPPRGAAGGGSAEETLIANSLKEHNGNHKEALIALQTGMIRERTSQGFSKKAAREQCEKQYPKIFSAAG